MPGAAEAEVYFIAAMMALILIISAAAVYFFMKEYKKETRERIEREKNKRAGRTESGELPKSET